jgi:uncharacterized protein
MTRVAAFLCGLIFGVGLIVSQMTDPLKVIGFLDVFGQWDPSLALVMGGALAVAAIGFWWVERRGDTMLGTPLALPARRPVDRRLLAGSALFGVGWGLAGFCPGPALVGTAALSLDAALFVVAMLAGMVLANRLLAGNRNRTGAERAQ